MGRVFSAEDVERGKVPSKHDFATTLEDFTRASQLAIEAGAIKGTVIFGSVAAGHPTPRSDFDCMIMPPEHSSLSQEAIRRIVAVAEGYGAVIVNPIVHPRTVLSSGKHEIDRYFGQHLCGENRIVLGEDPASIISFGTDSALTIWRNYLHNKKRRIGSAQFKSGEEELRKLATLLELPTSIGRKTLQAVSEVSPKNLLNDDAVNKSHVLAAAQNLWQALGIESVPRDITKVDTQYTLALSKYQQEEITRRDYRASIEEIRRVVQAALNWLDEVEIAVEERYFT